MADFKKKFKTTVLARLAAVLFVFQRMFTRMKVINYPAVFPAIFALRHAHQCAIWSIKDHEHLYSLISSSSDGTIIDTASKAVGLRTVRGSSSKKGAKATMQLLEKLEQNNSIAITIDGPRGPKHVVKDGVVHIAKISQVPIVPFVWYCPSPLWLKFDTWDEFRFTVFAAKTIVVYGEPIYVPSELTDEEVEFYRLKVENQLNELYEDAQRNYKKYMRDC